MNTNKISYSTQFIESAENKIDTYLHGNESAEMTASITESHRSLPAKGLIPEERNVDALEPGQSNVIASKIFDVSDAVNDDRSPARKRRWIRRGLLLVMCACACLLIVN